MGRYVGDCKWQNAGEPDGRSPEDLASGLHLTMPCEIEVCGVRVFSQTLLATSLQKLARPRKKLGN
jgi:hypothetical protein